MLGDNDADVDALVAQVPSTAEAEIGRQYLERASDRHPWMVGDDGEVAGRLLGYDDRDSDSPYKLVVDGRTIS